MKKNPSKTITPRNLQTYVAQNLNNVQEGLRNVVSEEPLSVSVKTIENPVQQDLDTEKNCYQSRTMYYIDQPSEKSAFILFLYIIGV